MSGPNAVNVDAIDSRATSAAAPATAQQIDGMAAAGKSSENLMEMKLCASRLRVLSILPVEDEYFH
jgi:fatty acid-binding protein DegV